MIKVSTDRIRSLVSGCITEMEVAAVLRSHKIHYTFTTETGILSIRIPCRKGSVQVYRTCSRSNPFAVHGIRSNTVYHVPVLYND